MDQLKHKNYKTKKEYYRKKTVVRIQLPNKSNISWWMFSIKNNKRKVRERNVFINLFQTVFTAFKRRVPFHNSFHTSKEKKKPFQ